LIVALHKWNRLITTTTVSIIISERGFHVYWDRVLLQNRPEVGAFTFSASLYPDGDIVFAYYSLPIAITNIEDDKHPVKVGVSDAYIIDKTVFHARRLVDAVFI